ncbi:MAG: hypothetical protein ABIG69_05485 [Bacteroidota bacterium]
MINRIFFVILVSLFFSAFLSGQTLVSPPNTITGVSVLPMFQWDQPGAVESFTLKYGTTSTVYTNTVSVVVNSNASINGGDVVYYAEEDLSDFPLANDDWYYWTVEYDPGTGAVTMPEFSFKTVLDVNLTLAWPTNSTYLQSFDPLNFAWTIDQSNGSLRYKLDLIEADSEPAAADWLTPDQSFGNLSVFYKSVTGLNAGSKFYWRVTAYYDDGTSSSSFDADDRVVKISSINSFTTSGGAVEAYPSWPIDNPTVYTLKPSFYWYTEFYEPGATYNVLLSTSNSVDGGALNGTLITTNATPLTVLYYNHGANLTASTPYYWQVKTI